ncbi:MAG: hypothetical protein GX555_08325 [Actinomycetales bacterium]|nr:hypothetical protein [Actinomycetales bacterium]
MIWSMGALAMHEHVRRLLGVDFLAVDAPPESLRPYLRPMLELFSQGLMEEGAFDEMVTIFDPPESLPTDLTRDDDPEPRTRERNGDADE